MRPEDRERAQLEASSRVVDRLVAQARTRANGDLEALVRDTLYHERRRLEKAHSDDARARADGAFYHRVQRRLRHASERDLRRLLDEIARRFAAEIVGNFDERVYKLSTTVIPAGLSALLGAVSPRKLASLSALRSGLSEHVQIQGAVEHARRLLDHGTLIVVPTHSCSATPCI
jgi:glycerol-3-phosphate O-acyltransferase